MFQRILVAVDPSPARHSVIRLAGDMARLTGAKVSVLHVAPSSATLAAVVPLEDDAEAKAILDEALAALKRMSQQRNVKLRDVAAALVTAHHEGRLAEALESR